MTKQKLLLWVITSFLFFTGCKHFSAKDRLFTRLDAKHSGIDFINAVEETDSTKSFINEFGYMGGGVGIGDFNNDGLKDILFTGNQVSCRLYINKGHNRFEDITERAGLITNIWATGVSIADINNDGYDDLYVCSYGKDLMNRAKNLLFINQHNLTFSEQAQLYGLADTSYSSQAAFFDYDKDGDLDVYLANYMLNGPNANTLFHKDTSGSSAANDRLYRNEGDAAGAGHPVFTDVTFEANIKEDGFGLGLVITDVNNDNWPDIYVANDFVSNDVLWLNNKNGTFANCIDKAVQHTSYSSMGADAADINNDGRPDIATLDMLPEYNKRKKTSFSVMNYNRYESERAMGYQPEFVRNMLQLNNGTYKEGETEMPFFSEIGQLAGIPATDWSWSVLMADFDNDGWKDMHITNGVGRDFINGDFLEFSNEILSTSAEAAEKQKKIIRDKLASLKHIALQNYLYLNNKDYTFTDVSATAGTGDTSMSNGAAYADLDNDGDLDLIINNINSEAFILLNNAVRSVKEPNHSIKISLTGDNGNRHALGSKVFIYTGVQVQMQEQNPVRGYYSSVDQQLVFGLGKNTGIDSMVIVWPNDKKLVLTHMIADSTYTFYQKDAVIPIHGQNTNHPFLFSAANAATAISYLHRENNYNDFDNQRLLPQKFSRLGPFIATGDINSDKLVDFFVGGAFNASGKFFIQQPNGLFISRSMTDNIKMEEDADCVFFDADGDADLDLLVTYGETSYEDNSPFHRPCLFRNDGHGNFSPDKPAIPENVQTVAGCVAPGDYDKDGDIDLFIGGRVSSKYPTAPKSYILENNQGAFTDVTARVCPALQRAGMITAAAWSDYDQNGTLDLVIAGEWLPIRFFKNRANNLYEATTETNLSNMEGMWRSLAVTDMDNDGDADIVAGNLGSNCIYHARPDQPMHLIAADIDRNGSIDPALFYYIKDANGKSSLRPAVSRSQFAEQVPLIKKRFLLYADYSSASVDDIYKGVEQSSIQKFTCNETRSCYLENVGNGKFIKHILPQEAQFAPVNTIVCTDVDSDGYTDLLLAGNEYQTEVMTGRYDASYGCYLKGGKGGVFKAIEPATSGFIIRGDVKDMELLDTPHQRIILSAVNNDSLQVFRINN